jgi:hypothetical protein
MVRLHHHKKRPDSVSVPIKYLIVRMLLVQKKSAQGDAPIHAAVLEA